MISEIELKKEFKTLSDKYSDLAGVLKGIIEDQLIKAGIGFERVHGRVKTWESFWEKVNEKGYQSPLNEIHDICGLRIIILNYADLDKIHKTIQKEFNIVENEDKKDDLSPDQFGYRSHHLIITIRDEWMAAPQFRDCEGLRFEVQIRTELMDAWANISHQMFYKKGPIQTHVRRRLHRLSALMEIGDSEISQLIIAQPHHNNNLPPKLKELQDILDRYLPDRKRTSEKSLVSLYKDMEEYDFSLKKLTRYFETELNELLKIETDVFSQVQPLTDVETRWWQIGIVRNFMYLTIDEYWLKEGKHYSDHYVTIIESKRGVFKLRNDEN